MWMKIDEYDRVKQAYTGIYECGYGCVCKWVDAVIAFPFFWIFFFGINPEFWGGIDSTHSPEGEKKAIQGKGTTQKHTRLYEG